MKGTTLLLILFVLISACGKDKKASQKSSLYEQDVSAIYKTRNLAVQVYYEEGADPYDRGPLGAQIWNLFQDNLDALFEGRKLEPLIIIPKTLAEMTKFSARNRSKWSIDDVLNLDKSMSSPVGPDTLVFKIFFVNGVSEDSSDTIGFHITGTRVMVIFKDVIKGTSGNSPFVSMYVEQATLIHEMGHALGLVNNGLPMQSSHQDKAHGAHCSQTDCVMYWANEGRSSMITFAQKLISTQSNIMFDSQCLQDSREY